MPTNDVQSIIRTMVDACGLTVVVRSPNGPLAVEGESHLPAVAEIQGSLRHLEPWITSGPWWGPLRQLILRDSTEGSWIVHLEGADALTGHVLAIGPLAAGGPWSLGQILQILAPTSGLLAPLSTRMGPAAPGRASASLFRFMRRDFQPAILEAIRRGDMATLDLLVERLIGRWPAVKLDDDLLRVKTFLFAFVTLTEEAAIQGGLDPLDAEDLGEIHLRALIGARTPREAILSAMTMMRNFAARVAGAPFKGRSTKSRALVRHIQEHLAEELTLEAVAREVGISPNYASTLLKKEGGAGFTATVHRLRVARAQILLRAGDATIAEVAAQVGFSHPNHFSRVFRSIVGQNPRDYRMTVSEFGEPVPSSPPE